MILTEEKINLSRQREFDVVKTICILAMIVTHVYEELSVADSSVLCQTPFDVILQFLGGPIGAPVFMFAMGLGMSYSKHNSPKELCGRGIKLFVFSYLFNLVRFVIPDLIGMTYKGFDFPYIIYETFHVDVLTFAGLAFLLTALLKKLKVPVIGVLGIAVLMQTAGTVLGSAVTVNSTFGEYFFAMFFHTGEPAYFPLLLWYVYPALGLVFAKYLRHITDTDRFYKGVFILSASVTACFCVTLGAIGYDIRLLFSLAGDSVYAPNFLVTFFSLCCILLEISVVHFILKYVHLPRVEKLLAFFGNNLNNIYIVQWMIIGWVDGLAVGAVTELPIAAVVPVGLAVTAVSCLVVILFQKVFKKQNII